MTVEQDKRYKKEVSKMTRELRAKQGFIHGNIIKKFGSEQRLTNQYHNRAIIKGIEEPFYSALNGAECTIIFNRKMYKPQTLSDGSFRKDEEGNLVTDHIPVPQECIVIRSPINIKLRRTLPDGSVYNEKSTFMYLQYVTVEGQREYLYIIPREVVFRKNKLLVVLGENSRPHHYGEVRLLCRDGRYRYVAIISTARGGIKNVVKVINDGEQVGNVLVKTVDILTGWGVVFNRKLGGVQNEEGAVNLFYDFREATLDKEEFTAIGECLSKDEEEHNFDH